jgi:PKHD-type hydroxylase
MNCDPQYWFWKAEIPDSVCDAIITEGLKLTANAAVVGTGSDSRVDPAIRESKTAFFPSNSWVAGITAQYMNMANISAWKFDITEAQSPQFTIYDQNEFYEFHTDDDFLKDGMRKLSVVISITDPTTYEGGEFEFENCVPEIRSRGSVMVFPSFLRHRVKPVTSGTRYSLVNWFIGPQFK